MTKAKQIIFTFLLIFLPSQLGLHFWPEWAFINGVRIDYFSPTLYFTDVLVIALLLLELRVKKEELKKSLTIKNFLIISFFLALSLLNINSSLSPFVSLYKWLKVAEFGFLAWYVTKNKPSFKLLLIPIVYSCFLAAWQYFNHGSIGGLWYFLGERAFTFDTPGIAAWRPYATFSHPNALAGFLVVAGLLVSKYIPHNSRIITVVVISLIIFLTLSKGSLINGWELRQQLNNIAVKQFISSPLVGTGLGTSPLYPRNVSNFAMLHQPIHNIYLLLLCETGIIGLGLFFIVIIKRFKWLLLPVLILGFFDHYWLTLQQNQLLLAILIGLSYRRS